MDERKPSFLIIGAQRSASTFLSSCMGRHPDVYLPHREVEYFEDPVYDRRAPSFLGDLFARAPEAQAYGFKRPELLARPECPARIAAEIPDVRLIAVLREPVSRTISAYFHYAQGRGIPLMPLNEGLRRILDGDLSERYPMSRFIVEYSRYGEHISRYRDYFDAESMLVLFDHDLAGQTAETMRRVFGFVGVDTDGEFKYPVVKSNVGAYSMPRLRYLRFTSPLGYAYHPGQPYGSVRRSPAALAAYKLAWRVDRMVLARVFGNERPCLDDDVRERLGNIFRADAVKLEALLGSVPAQWGMV